MGKETECLLKWHEGNSPTQNVDNLGPSELQEAYNSNTEWFFALELPH